MLCVGRAWALASVREEAENGPPHLWERESGRDREVGDAEAEHTDDRKRLHPNSAEPRELLKDLLAT